MHIAEGILPAEWAAAWAAPAAVGAVAGLRRLKARTDEEPAVKSLVALMGAAVFAISLMPIPVPVAGSVSHPAGTPLAAIVVGPAAGVLLAAVSLLLQALFFAHGGLTTLGANIVSEGIVGSVVGFGVFRLARRSGLSLFLAGFLAGVLGDLAVYFTTATELSLGLFSLDEAWPRLWAIFLAFLPTQGPLALLEGLFTGGVLRSLAQLRPDIASRLGVDPGDGQAGGPGRRVRASHRRVRRWWGSAGRPLRIAVGTLVALAAGAAVWGLVWAVAASTGGWVGLDEGVMERVAAERGRAAWTPLINTDVGDLLLYVFFAGALGAGALIGWVARGLRPPAPVGRGGPGSHGDEGFPGDEGRARSGHRPALGAAAGVLMLLGVWAGLAPGVRLGPVDGRTLRDVLQALLHPGRQRFLSARGGDVVLFAFMMSGLILGTVAGYRLRGRRAEGRRVQTGRAEGRRVQRRRHLRLRLPHLHIHDVSAGDRVAWQNRGLGAVDARVKIAGVALLLVANLMAGWWLSLSLLVAGSVILFGVQRVRRSVVLIRMAPALIVSFMLVALRGVTVPGRAFLVLSVPGLKPVAFTLDGMLAGLELGLVVLAGVMAMLLLGLTTPLPRLLAALRWYRVPELLIEMGTLMYRYLFLFVEETSRMRQAQRLRGPDVPWSRAMGGFSSLGANLLIRSYERSQRVYAAQCLRGGVGHGPAPGRALRAVTGDETEGRKR